MKASKLIKQLQKAIDKYGDINVGARDQCDAHALDCESDTFEVKFRVLNNDSYNLPGESMDEEEEQKSSSGDFFGVIFYED